MSLAITKPPIGRPKKQIENIKLPQSTGQRKRTHTTIQDVKQAYCNNAKKYYDANYYKIRVKSMLKKREKLEGYDILIQSIQGMDDEAKYKLLKGRLIILQHNLFKNI
jgi:hypothetical protein